MSAGYPRPPGRAPLVAMLVACAVNTARAESQRQLRPLSVTAAGNLVLPSAGVDASYQLADRLGLGGQITCLLWAHVDLSARVRMFVLARETWGLYLGVNVHGWYSPLILEKASPLLTGEVGYEYRGPGGRTIGAGLGGGALYERRHAAPGHSVRFQPVFMANLRIGKAW